MFKTIFSIAFTVCLLCTALTAQTADPWKKYTSAEGRFNVLVPCTFETSAEDFKNESGTIKQYYHNCQGGNAIYMVTYADFPKSADADKLLDHYRDGVTSETPLTPGSEKKITFSNNPGREFTVKSGPTSNDLCYTWRILFVKGRLYALGVTTRAFAADPELATKFFASFALEK